LIASVFSLQGFAVSNTKASAKNYDFFYKNSTYKSFKFSLIGSFVLLCLGLFVIYFERNFILGILLVLALFYVPTYSFRFYDNFLYGKRQYSLSRKIFILEKMLRIIVIGLTSILSSNIVLVFISDLIIQILMSAIGTYITMKKVKSKLFDLGKEKEYNRLGWRMTVLGVIAQISSKIENIVLGTLNPEALAIYHIGDLIPSRIRQNAKVIISVPYTNWISLPKEEHVKKVKKYSFFFLLLGLVIYIFLYLVTPSIIPIFFTKEYSDSIWITQLISVSLIFVFLHTMIIGIITYQGYEAFYQRIQIISSILKICLLYIFLSLYGYKGVVFAVILSEGFLFLIVLAWFLQQIKFARLR